MSQKEKMLKGELYYPNEEQLIKERAECKTLCSQYNSIDINDIEKRTLIIKKLLGKTEGDFLIEPSFWCDYGYNIEIGKNFYSNHNLVILDPAKVIFGDNVFIGPNCGFYTAQHPLDFQTRNQCLEYAQEITVGNNVWFGGNVTVLGGVKIGDNSVIGVGSTVVKDIPSNSLALGCPAKAVKKI